MSKRLRCSERVASANQIAKVTSEPSVRVASRDNKKIMKKWWNDHRKKNENLLKDKEYSDALLASEKALVQQLREENERLTKLREQDAVLANALIEKNVALSNTCAEVANQNAALAHELVVAKGMPPFIKKESDRTSLVKMIGAAILFIFNIIMYRTQPLTRLRALVEAVFEMEIFGSFQTEKVLKEVSTKYARNTVFLPWKVLKSMDLAINGGINFTGLEALRKVEGLGDHQRGFLPSRASVQRCAAQLHDLGQDLIPFEKVDSQLGEMHQFHYEKLVRFILKMFSLHELSLKESVELCITLDGAELTKDLCHLTFGLKVTDPRAIDPRDGTPLACQEDGAYGQFFKVQSRNYCFVMKTLLGKDSKAAYREFADVFKFFEKLMLEGLPENEHGPRIMPLLIWSPQDMSSIWKSLNTGGGARKSGDRHWCHLCPCTGNKIASFLVDENRFVAIQLVSVFYTI